MNVFLISISTGTVVFLLVSIIQDIIYGDRGRNGQISKHYSLLKDENNNARKKTKKLISFKINNSGIKHYYLYALPASIIIFLFMLLSFKSFFMATALSLFGVVLPRIMYNNALKRRRLIMQNQFRDALSSIMASLKAGLSINSALIKCAEDLERLYSYTKDKPILEEFIKIKKDLIIGLSVEEALNGFKERTEMEDIDDFVNSVTVVRQKGGNLVEIMENVVGMITEKITIKNEIAILTTGKRMESKIITFIPIFIVIVLSVIAPNYMKPLYSSLVGKILIVIGFMLLLANYFIGRRITNIEV